MIPTLLSSLLFAQLAAPATLEEDRLQACMDEARANPATAMTTASQWLEGTTGAELSYPYQCLGFAYMSLLRWSSAKEAFTQARDARLPDDHKERARLGGMAGNAALADASLLEAIDLLGQAQADAEAAGESEMAGQLATDRARALVALGQDSQAADSLGQARALAPQDPQVWLLSATLARRMEDLENAQGWIETAAALAPRNPAIGVEAGVIAALAGRDEAARQSWQSVLDTAAASPQAEQARAYLAQLAEPEQTATP